MPRKSRPRRWRKHAKSAFPPPQYAATVFLRSAHSPNQLGPPYWSFWTIPGETVIIEKSGDHSKTMKTSANQGKRPWSQHRIQPHANGQTNEDRKGNLKPEGAGHGQLPQILLVSSFMGQLRVNVHRVRSTGVFLSQCFFLDSGLKAFCERSKCLACRLYCAIKILFLMSQAQKKGFKLGRSQVDSLFSISRKNTP